VRYSSRELFDIFLEFLRDKRERQRIYKLDSLDLSLFVGG
jgi:hypothetical protein